MVSENASFETYTNNGFTIQLDNKKDSRLTKFAKVTLKERYLWKDETIQQMFGRVATVNADNAEHAQRIYNYISDQWFMPATPVLSNSGHEKALPISCFLNSVGDSLEEINETYSENMWLAARGGGIGTSWSEVRSIGERVSEKGETSGIIPFIKIQDSMTLGISQGNLRRGSAAAYLNIDHPEILEFIDIRRPEGDPNRKCLNIHNGVVVTDKFMEAAKNGTNWDLVSPVTGAIVNTIPAREIWQKLVKARLETGEPYIWFVDNVNRQRPETYKRNDLYSTQSNLCSEIALTTGIDYNGVRRTAVCCLSSLNLETFDQWNGNELFIEDVLIFLDNVMTNFIRLTENVSGFERARYSAIMERSVGLGVMGFHSWLQSKMIPFESVMAKVWNVKIFKWIKETGDRANMKLGKSRGPCPDAARVGLSNRFSHIFAVAPTASISTICGEASPGIEPYISNAYKQKTLSGAFAVRNKWLDLLLKCKAIPMFDDPVKEKEWVEAQWSIITANGGSVQDLTYLEEIEKETFKTAFEIDQNWVIEHAADRTPYICQGQSLNIFIKADADKKYINQLHFKAWEMGVKALYYCRSKAVKQATNVVGELPKAVEEPKVHLEADDEYEVSEADAGCLACQ